MCRPRRTRGQQPVFRGGGVWGRGAGLASLPAAGASARGPRSQAPAPAGAQHAHVGTWPSRRHTVAKATGRAVSVRAKESVPEAARRPRGHTATVSGCPAARSAVAVTPGGGTGREDAQRQGRARKPRAGPSLQRPSAPSALRGRQTLPAGPSCVWRWLSVKPQKFQGPRPSFREPGDKVISPGTHRGWVPGRPSLLQARRSPRQHSRQTVTQQTEGTSCHSPAPRPWPRRPALRPSAHGALSLSPRPTVPYP